jgi:hypothetical protein
MFYSFLKIAARFSKNYNYHFSWDDDRRTRLISKAIQCILIWKKACLRSMNYRIQKNDERR